MKTITFRRNLLIGVAVLFIAALGIPNSGATDPIDLSSWTAVTLDLPGGQSGGNWVLSNGNTTATQTVNADPSFFLNNLNQTNYTMDGSWRVVTSQDDDFIGFVFGYQDSSNFYVMDWKQAYQNQPDYGIAQEGFSIKKISAPSVSDLTLGDFWESSGTGHSSILASNFGSGLGWSDFTTYHFHLYFQAGSFNIVVSEGDTELWNITVNDSSFTSGQFGFYNFSQEMVEYSGFVQGNPPVVIAGPDTLPEDGIHDDSPFEFNETISFVGQTFHPDSAGGAVIDSTRWDFDDGVSIKDQLEVQHQYTGLDGQHTAILTAWDNRGLSASDTLMVWIAPPPPEPVLSWTREIGYETDGVSPDTGLNETLFQFRVIYTDSNNIPPAPGYPTVNIDINGDGDFNDVNEGSFAMGPADADTIYSDGKLYYYNTTLPVTSTCQHSFSAQNDSGQTATGEPTALKPGPVILDDALDLYIYASDIEFSNSNPNEGEVFTVTATVHNNSDSNLTNVSVTFYADDYPVDTIIIPYISHRSSGSASTNLSFDIAGFYPIKVVADEENSFEEWNELNNFAIRPVVVGDYEIPGGIAIQASLNSPVYPYSWITIFGDACYYPDTTEAVSGARVTATVVETGEQFISYTNSLGNIQMGFNGPYYPGIYHINLEITDFTLTADTTLILEVVVTHQPDLVVGLSLSNYQLILNQPTTVTTTIQNIGDSTAYDFSTGVYKDNSLYHSEATGSLLPGNSAQLQELAMSFSTVGFHTISARVDLYNSVLEVNEANNSDWEQVFVACDGSDLAPFDIVFSDYTPAKDQIIGITARIRNLGSVGVGSFGVEFSDNGVPIDTVYGSISSFGATSNLNISHAFSSAGWHTIRIVADPEGSVAECDEGNNIYEENIYVHEPSVDLVVEYEDIYVGNTDPDVGDTIRLVADIHNWGEAVAYDVAVRLFIDSVQIGDDIIIPELGGSHTVTSTEPWTVDFDCHSMRVVADPENLIYEPNELNNEATCPLPYELSPNYRDSCWAGPGSDWPWFFSECCPFVGDSIDIYGSVVNYGGFDVTQGLEIEFVDDVEGSIGTIVVNNVLNHRANEVTGHLSHAFSSPGWHVVTAIIDPSNQYSECNEENNTYSRSIYVSPSYPDLMIHSDHIQPTDINPDSGEAVDIYATIFNIGDSLAEDVWVRMLVDGNPLGTDLFIDSIPSPPAPDSYRTVVSSEPWIATDFPANLHIIRVIADPEDSLLESNEENNEASRAIIVGGVTDFTLEVDPDTLEVQAGNSVNCDVILISLNGFASACTLTISGLPTDASESFNPNPVIPTDTSDLQINTEENTPPDIYTMIVTASEMDKGIVHTAELVLIVTPPPDFTIEVEPDTLEVQAGNSVNCDVILTSLYGFASPCTLTVSGLPTDASGSFDLNPVVPTDTSNLQISTAETSPPDTYSVTVTASEQAKSIVHNAELVLIVTPPPDFAIEVSPETLEVAQGDEGNYEVILTSLYGFDSPCTLTVSGLPPDASGEFDPATLIPTGTSALAVSMAETTPTGTYPLTITATELSKAQTQHSTQVVLIVTPPPDPRIISITDVGNDQGKQVRVKWHCCYYDTVGSPVTITEYSLWRRIDESKATIQSNEASPFDLEKFGKVRVYSSGDWELTKTVPATGESTYTAICSTLVDSTQAGGMYWSVFFVRAMTPDTLIYFDSDPDSGYSLDNIPPLPIQDLEIDPNSWFTLEWTVPGEYVGEEPISSYDIRYNTVPVGADTQAWWDNAEACAGEGFFNLIVGDTDSLKVATETWCHPECYFAIKGLDSRPNASGISNIVHFMCGDVNGDGVVELGDVVKLINYLYRGGLPPEPVATGDVTCDGVVELGDVVYLINYLYRSGPPPCSP